MDQIVSLPGTPGATPPVSASRFTAHSLQDLVELLKGFQEQSAPEQSTSPDADETARAQD